MNWNEDSFSRLVDEIEIGRGSFFLEVRLMAAPHRTYTYKTQMPTTSFRTRNVEPAMSQTNTVLTATLSTSG